MQQPCPQNGATLPFPPCMGYAVYMQKPKVYLDNCVYNRPFDDQTQIKILLEAEAKRHIQRLIMEKYIELVYSYVNRLENEDNPYKARKKSIASFFAHAIHYIDHSRAQAIEERAAAIMEAGIKVKDALHISCPLKAVVVILSLPIKCLCVTNRRT